MGVIDILPNCVSSVYFMYEKKWEKYSFGKVSVNVLHHNVPLSDSTQLSALREAALAKEMHEAGVADMRYLYMG